MKLLEAFKYTILINVALFFLIIASAFYADEELTKVSESLPSGLLYESVLGLIVSSLYSIASFVALYMIYKLKSFGRKLYTICFFIGCFVTLLGGPLVIGSIVSLLYELIMVTTGAILVFLYSPFDEVKRSLE